MRRMWIKFQMVSLGKPLHLQHLDINVIFKISYDDPREKREDGTIINQRIEKHHVASHLSDAVLTSECRISQLAKLDPRW